MSCTNVLGLITMGDCSATTESVSKQVNETVNNVMTDVLVSQMSKNSADIEQVQEIRAKAGIGNIDISDINLKQEAFLKFESFEKSITQNEVDNMITSIADQLAEKAAETIQSPGGAKASTESTTEIKNIMTTTLKNSIKVEQISECIASVNQKQRIVTGTEVGDISIKGINMEQHAKAIASCVGEKVTETLNKNESLQKAVQKLDEDLKTTSKGPFDFLTDIFGNLTTLAIAGGVILVVLILLGGIGFLIFTNMGGIEKVGAVTGQSTIPGTGMATGYTPQTGYTPGYSSGYSTGYTPQYSYSPGQVGYGLGKLEPSFWAKMTQSTYPVLSRFFNILK